jgi:predicted dehydrogenase
MSSPESGRGWRIGILSATGTAWKRTIPALRESAVCRVTVVHGRDPDRLRSLAASRPDLRLASSLEDFAALRDDYDVIFVGSPPFLHVRDIRLAADIGRPVLCEKPLVARREDLQELAGLLERLPAPLAVAHHLRHQPVVADVAELLASGRLGRPVAASLQWGYVMDRAARNARWKLDPGLGGSNAMFDCGVHALDLAVLFFGLPGRVGAVAHRARSGATDDSVTATLDYADLAATVVASQSATPGGNDLRILFRESLLVVEGLFGEKSAARLRIDGGAAAGTVGYEPVNLYRQEVENFCRALEGRVTAGTGPADSLGTSRILFAIEESVQTGAFVQISSPS